ncbi:MAG: hypothetical protein WA919_19590 [Coleofasciculaceae cyanobacterium]
MRRSVRYAIGKTEDRNARKKDEDLDKPSVSTVLLLAEKFIQSWSI